MFFFSSGNMKHTWQGFIRKLLWRMERRRKRGHLEESPGQNETGDHKFIMTPVFMVL